jgi:major membrane immunogen (membrane-anchored lipoprotein)
MKRIAFTFGCVMLLALALIGCNGSTVPETTVEPPDTTDEMWSESKTDVEIEVYVQDGHVYTAEYDYELPELAGRSDLIDGASYLVTADVTFLNGGVAGYVDYPQIDRIISIEEITTSPHEANQQQ